MTNARYGKSGQVNSDPGSKSLWRIHWLGGCAVLGALLLSLGAVIASAGVLEESTLPSILQQLKAQGKEVKSTSVFDSGANSQIVVVCANGESRTYNAQGQLLEVKDAQGRATLFTDGLEVEERNAAGTVVSRTEYVRTPSGKVRESIKHGIGGTETKLFDDQGNVIQAIDAQGTKIFGHYVRDGQGRTLGYQEVDQSTGEADRVVLDPRTGEVSEKIDDNGVHTRMEYERSASGEITAVTERTSNGQVTVKRFKDGQLASVVSNGVTTTYENVLNSAGMLQETKETTVIPASSGSIVQIATKHFDDAGRLVRTEDKDGVHEYSYTFGTNGLMASRTERLTSRQGQKTVVKTTVTTFDGSGRISSVATGGKLTAFVYKLDDNGNVLSQTETQTFHIDNQVYQETTVKAFDGQGHLLSVIDGSGKKTSYAYDGKGNKKTEDTADSHTDYFYDDYDILKTSVTREKKVVTITNYDAEGKLATDRLRILHNGFTEVSTFGDNSDGERTEVTVEQFGIKTTTFVDRESEQPKQTLLVKFNGKVITTEYGYAGDHLLTSHEVTPQGTTDTQYTLDGKPAKETRIDKWGRAFNTTFAYAGGKLRSSVETDKKGTTTTQYDADENAQTITRVNAVGFPRRSVETRTYVDGDLSSSVSVDIKGETTTQFDLNGLATTVHRKNKHGFPRENDVVNHYDAGGDLKSTDQTDNRGTTHSDFDADGLMTASVRTDIYGFPKLKSTTYHYAGGELVSSTLKDDRGITQSQYNADGLMTQSVRTKLYGYPRTETTSFAYDKDGYMVSSREDDKNGTTDGAYNIDELMVKSVRHNLYGHAREQTTAFQYDDEGFMTASTETDLRGQTTAVYDRNGLTQTSQRNDQYGLGYSRLTDTINQYDGEGFLTVSSSKNQLGGNETHFDRDGLARQSVQQDNFGLGGGRKKTTDQYVYDPDGHVQQSVETDKLGQTNSTYDINGDPIQTDRQANFGLGATRRTTTVSTFNTDTGMTTSSISKNDYGTTTSSDFDPITGLAKKQTATNNYGLGFGRVTQSDLTINTDTGLTEKTVATNPLGVTTSLYTQDTYGTLDTSDTVNNYGLGFCKHAYTKVDAINQDTGLNLQTTTINSSEANGQGKVFSTTVTDQYDPEYGTPLHQTTENRFGVGFSRLNWTNHMDVNHDTGLNRSIESENKLAVTTSYYDDQAYGTLQRSDAVNKFGLGFCQNAHTEVDAVNTDTGFSKHTTTTNYLKTDSGTVEFSKTVTDDFDPLSGTPKHQITDNQFGVNFSRHNETKHMDVNQDNGLNQRIVSENKLAVTTSVFDDQEYGTMKTSNAVNAFGLGFARNSYTVVNDTNYDTGYNLKTTSINSSEALGQGTVLSVTVTDQYNQQTGTPEHQITDNTFGVGFSRHNETQSMDINQNNGLNREVVSKNGMAVTSTEFDDQTYGTFKRSTAANAFGLGFCAQTVTELDGANGMNYDNGFQKRTKSVNSDASGKNVFSTTWTDYDDQHAGVPVSQHSVNNFGVVFARDNQSTKMDVNLNNGLNRETVMFNQMAETTTKYRDQDYGTMVSSDANNTYGLGFCKHAYTTIDDGDGTPGMNFDNGFNRKTKTVNSEQAGGQGTIFSEVWTHYDDTLGTSTAQRTLNHFGLIDARDTTTTKLEVNRNNGLNKHIETQNAMGTVKTDYDDDEYGVPTSQVTDNNYGVGFSKHTETREMDVNKSNGLNQKIVSFNQMATVTTVFDGDRYGTVRTTDSNNNYGLGFCKHAYSFMENEAQDMNFNTGMYVRNVSVNSSEADGKGQRFSTTATTFDPQYGTAASQHTVNEFGVRFARVNDTVGKMDVNIYNGLNHDVVTDNGMATTESLFDDSHTGVMQKSWAHNKFGLKFSAWSYTSVDSFNGDTGFNEQTTTVNREKRDGGQIFSTVTTTYDQQHGTPLNQVTRNQFGVDFSRKSWTTQPMDINANNGLTREINTQSGMGKTQSKFDDQNYGVMTSSWTENVYGVSFCRWTYTHIDDFNFDTGFNKKTTTVNRSKKGGDSVQNELGQPDGGVIYSIVVTDEYDQQVGTPKHQTTTAFYGLGYARESWTNQMQVNPKNGLNTHIEVESKLAVTKTDYDDAAYGVPTSQTTDSNYGLGFAKHTWTLSMDINKGNGQSREIVTKNQMNQTTTRYRDADYGTVHTADSLNNYGVGFAKHTYTFMENESQDMNFDTGLYFRNVSRNCAGADGQGQWLSETRTEYDQTYGTPTELYTKNHYGVLLSRDNYSLRDKDGHPLPDAVKVNHNNGLNESMSMENGMATTTTTYDGEKTGCFVSSTATNKFGLGYSKQSVTTVSKEGWLKLNGVQEQTKTVNSAIGGGHVFSTVLTTFDYQASGTPVSQITDNTYGVTDSLHNWTNTMTINKANGLNDEIQTENKLTRTTTKYDKDNYGDFVASNTENLHYGLTACKFAYMTLVSDGINHGNGFLKQTKTVNSSGTQGSGTVYSTVTTNYDDGVGTPTQQVISTQYAVQDAQSTTVVISTNGDTGLFTKTVATNGVNRVTTDQFDAKTGVALHSETYTFKSIKNTQTTYTTMNYKDFSNGMAASTYSRNDNGYGTTTLDGTHGTPVKNVQHNYFGYTAFGDVTTTYTQDGNLFSVNIPTSTTSDDASHMTHNVSKFDATTGALLSTTTTLGYGPMNSRTSTSTFTTRSNGTISNSSCSGTNTSYDDVGCATSSKGNGMTTSISTSHDTGITLSTNTSGTPTGTMTWEHVATSNIASTGVANVSDTWYHNDGGEHWNRQYHGEAGDPRHTFADLKVQKQLGINDGHGWETYDFNLQIVAYQNLVFDHSLDEDCSFKNDGNTVTIGDGTREDGVATHYEFASGGAAVGAGGVVTAAPNPGTSGAQVGSGGATGVCAGDMLTMTDDKGTTVFKDRHRWSMMGSALNVVGGGFVYSGDTLTQINATNAKGSPCVFDAVWNCKTWNDSLGAKHSYSGTSTYKGTIWTAADETITDKEGHAWTGKVKYSSYGFYFISEVLTGNYGSAGINNGSGLLLNGTVAANSGKIGAAGAYNDVSIMLRSNYYTDKETFKFTQASDVNYSKRKNGNTVLTEGQNKDLWLTQTDLNVRGGVRGNVIWTIDASGAFTQAKVTDIRFIEEMFYLRDRYKPNDFDQKPPQDHFNTGDGDACPQSQNMASWNANRNKAFDSSAWGDDVVNVVAHPHSHSETTNCGTKLDPTKTCTHSWKTYSYSGDIVHYRKLKDGQMFWDRGDKVEDGFGKENDLATENVNGSPAAAWGPTGKPVSGMSVLTSLGNKSLAAALGSKTGQPAAGVAKKHGAEAPAAATPALAAQTGVQAAAVKAVQPQTGATPVAAPVAAVVAAVSAQPAVQATPAATTAAGKSQNTLRAALAALLKNTKLFGGQSAAFVEATLAKLGGKDVAAVLNGAADGLTKLAQAMSDSYEAMFGKAYQQSALGAVFEMVNQTFKLEPLRLLLLGEVAPADMKLAADKEQEFKDAQKIVRDENGRITLAVDKNGERHEFVYDESGETETVTSTKGQVRTRHLDPSGRLLSESQGGRTVTYKYVLDGQGRVKQTEAEEHSAKGVAKYIYDAQGKLQTLIANGKRKDYTATGAGAEEQLTVTTTEEKGGKFIEQKTYKAGRLETIKSADGTLTTYSYMTDGTGKVLATTVTVVDKDQQKTTLKYNAEGRLVSKNDQPVSRQEATIADQALTFEMEKQLSDPRLDNTRLDTKQQLQLPQAPPRQ